MKRIGVIVNPHSRRNRDRPELAAEALSDVVGDTGTVAAAGDAESLHAAARRFRDEGVGVLAVSGGDGTNGVVLTAFRDVWADAPLPLVAMLRGGTMNTVANGFGVPRGRPGHLLARLVADVRAERELIWVERPSLSANGRLGFLFGMGVLHGYLAEYYARSNGRPTPVTAATTLAIAIGSTVISGPTIQRVGRRDELELELDGEIVPADDYFALAAGTVSQVGLGFRPFYRCAEDPGRLQLLCFTTSAMGFVSDLVPIRLGRRMRQGHGLDRLVGQARIRPAGSTRTVAYMVDGDLMEADDELTLETGPLVRVVVGAR